MPARKQPLSGRDMDMLLRRYGLFDPDLDPMTHDQIAALYGISRQRVRFIESRTLQKLRDHPTVAQLRHLVED